MSHINEDKLKQKITINVLCGDFHVIKIVILI